MPSTALRPHHPSARGLGTGRGIAPGPPPAAPAKPILNNCQAPPGTEVGAQLVRRGAAPGARALQEVEGSDERLPASGGVAAAGPEATGLNLSNATGWAAAEPCHLFQIHSLLRFTLFTRP